MAVLNSNQDILRLIRSALEDEGYTVITEHIADFIEGHADLNQFLGEHRPAAIIYDLAPFGPTDRTGNHVIRQTGR